MSRPIAVSNLGPGIFTLFCVFFCLSKNTRFIFQLHKSITYIDGDAFLLYNLQDPPGTFLRLKVNVFQRYLALPYTFALKERFKYLVEFLGLLGSQ